MRHNDIGHNKVNLAAGEIVKQAQGVAAVTGIMNMV